MKLNILKGTTSKIVEVFIQDSSSSVGAGLTGLVFNSAGLTAYYALNGAAGGATVHTLATDRDWETPQRFSRLSLLIY